MKHSHISWTDHTFNPWWGCVEVSPGCDNCYARRDSIRYGFSVWGRGTQRRIFGEKHWREPVRWNSQASAEQPALVFCASMADILDADAPEGQLERLWDTIRMTPALLWLLLTKRPGRAFVVPEDIRRARNVLPGVSVESDEYLWRIDEAAQRFGRKVFVSAEPLVGPVHPDGRERSVAWMITGGESGPKARAARPGWFRYLRDWSLKHGIPFHFKQWGEFNEYLIRVGRATAGRQLDGLEWNARPGKEAMIAVALWVLMAVDPGDLSVRPTNGGDGPAQYETREECEIGRVQWAMQYMDETWCEERK